jgi:hypothetical protein
LRVRKKKERRTMSDSEDSEDEMMFSDDEEEEEKILDEAGSKETEELVTCLSHLIFGLKEAFKDGKLGVGDIKVRLPCGCIRFSSPTLFLLWPAPRTSTHAHTLPNARIQLIHD